MDAAPAHPVTHHRAKLAPDHDGSPVIAPPYLPKVVLLRSQPAAYPPDVVAQCSSLLNGNTAQLVITREFYKPADDAGRLDELTASLSETMRHTRCSAYAIVVADPAWQADVAAIAARHGVALDVYYAPGHVTFDRIFRAARDTCRAARRGNTTAVFVVSTADITLAAMEHIPTYCPAAFNAFNPQLLVVSRRDIIGGENYRDCRLYKCCS